MKKTSSDKGEGDTENIGIGRIFIAEDTVEYVLVVLKKGCLMKKAVEARRVDVRRLLRG